MVRAVQRIKVKCAGCGAEIEKYPAQVESNKTGRFLCSAACRKKVGTKPRKRAERTCEQCGEQFYPRHSEDARFCTRACHNKWQGRNGRMFTCEVCGNEFRLPPGMANRSGRWCTKVCETSTRRKRPLDREHNGKPALVDSNGYVRIWEPDNPSVMQGNWMFEHRFVAEQTLGRRLVRDEHVHHVNGDKADNRPENLAVMGHGEHSSVTSLANWDKMREWEEYRKRYGPLDRKEVKPNERQDAAPVVAQ